MHPGLWAPEQPWILILGGCSSRGQRWSERVERKARRSGLTCQWIAGVEDEFPKEHPARWASLLTSDPAAEAARPIRRLSRGVRRRSASTARLIGRLARLGTARWQWRYWQLLFAEIPAERRPVAVVWFDDDFLTTSWNLRRLWPSTPIVREFEDIES